MSSDRGETKPPPSDAPATGPRRVLLADDDRELCRAVGRVLTTAGFEVVVAHDGNAATEALIQGGFDVVLTDIHMPGASGVDLLRLTRAYDLDVPVVLMTAEPDVETALEAIDLGALKYLPKPTPPDQLVHTVERASRMHAMAKMKREALVLLGRAEREAGDRAGLTGAFDRALESLWVAFQPIVGTTERRAVAYEALVRSAEPTLRTPAALLEAAERLGRLHDLGARTRAVAAKQFASAPPGVLLFVNLHPFDLADPELASSSSPLSAIADRTVLEVTERDALDDVKGVDARLGILRFMGYRLAVDDLGAGYAGLTTLARLEPEFVKLDMSLVRDVHLSPVRRRLVGAMTALCREMTMRVIVEGVESTEELNELRKLGCDWMQGFYFGRPAREIGVDRTE